jgi:hypothetical protein
MQLDHIGHQNSDRSSRRRLSGHASANRKTTVMAIGGPRSHVNVKFASRLLQPTGRRRAAFGLPDAVAAPMLGSQVIGDYKIEILAHRLCSAVAEFHRLIVPG